MKAANDNEPLEYSGALKLSLVVQSLARAYGRERIATLCKACATALKECSNETVGVNSGN